MNRNLALPLLLLTVLALALGLAAQTSLTDDVHWQARCAELIAQPATPAARVDGVSAARLEELARERSHAGQHYTACSLFVAAAVAQSSAGNGGESQTDLSMAKLEQKLGAGKKLSFFQKLNHTAEVLQEAEKPAAQATPAELDAMNLLIPAALRPISAPPTPPPAPPQALPEPPEPAPQPTAGPAMTPAPAPAAALPNPPVSRTLAAGVNNWGQIEGHYVCYYFGYTGGAHYIGGMLYPNLGLVPAGIGLDILPGHGYYSNKGGSGKFAFSRKVPGKVRPEMLGTISFVAGSLRGRKALLQTHQQFQHAIIFPANWKMANGKSDAFSPSDTWCYQKH